MNPLRSRHIGNRSPRALAAVGVLLAALASASPAFAEAPAMPHLKLESRPAPTNLPLNGKATLVVTASNIGDAEANGEAHPITITDKLPAGVEATVISLQSKGTNRHAGQALGTCTAAPVKGPTPIVCTFVRDLAAYEQAEVFMNVKTSFPGAAEPSNEVSVTGGGAPSESLNQPLRVNGQPTFFGIEGYELTPENEEFEPDTQAGSHPFQLTTTFDLNQVLSPEFGDPAAPALQKNLTFKLPPGLVANANVVGNANAVQQCSDVNFGALEVGDINNCPGNTAVGVAVVTYDDPRSGLAFTSSVVPVFNLVPAPGEPARFGFEVVHVPIILDTSVRTGEDYGATVSVRNASEAVQVLGSRVTFWGVPGDKRHDEARGWECLGAGTWIKGKEAERPCLPAGLSHPAPFLMLPTACGPMTTTVEGEAWNRHELEAEGKAYKFSNEYTSTPAQELTGCESLPFDPSIKVTPGTEAASTPTDMGVDVTMPQQGTLEAEGKEEADIKKTILELPEGLQANPGAAGGLNTCAAVGKESVPGKEAIGFNGFESGLEEGAQLENDHFTAAAATCPENAKIGTVNIKTPLLEKEVVGSVYLAEQDTNPFRSPLVLYIVAEEKKSKVLVKLAGETQINPTTGQLVSVFDHTPQTPFESFELHLSKTERATQATPAHCGTYEAKATFVSWSSNEAAARQSAFQISSGPKGTPCPGAQLPFEPSFEAGSTNKQAGAFSPFVLKIERPDGDAALKTISMQLPPGAAAVLASVTPCPEPQAAEGTCGEESLVGHSISRSGLGEAPYALPGKVYLTGPYNGAPFGLSSVTKAVAGPFHLGTIVVRSTINVDPVTAAATINTEAAKFIPEPGKPGGTVQEFAGLPEILEGTPAQIKTLEVIVDRPGFEFNPTNCEGGLKITGELTGYEGGHAALSQPFYVSNCAALPFAPKLTASVTGQGSKTNGVTFAVTTESAGIGQANIHKVDLTLPEVLPSRLETIQKACVAAVFNANPAACNEGSVIGEATVNTPVFKKPLKGPAYLVSHGGAAFPDVEFVLQGENVTVILDGKTDIKKGITYSRFETAPDAPFTKFETRFPAGPHSALTAFVPEKENFNLCNSASKLVIPTTIVGQNGATIEQTTKIALEGCGGVKGTKVTKLTKAQLLAKALKTCRSKYKKKKGKRVVCEKQARKKYGTHSKKASKGGAKKSSSGAHKSARR